MTLHIQTCIQAFTLICTCAQPTSMETPHIRSSRRFLTSMPSTGSLDWSGDRNAQLRRLMFDQHVTATTFKHLLQQFRTILSHSDNSKRIREVYSRRIHKHFIRPILQLYKTKKVSEPAKFFRNFSTNTSKAMKHVFYCSKRHNLNFNSTLTSTCKHVKQIIVFCMKEDGNIWFWMLHISHFALQETVEIYPIFTQVTNSIFISLWIVLIAYI